MKLFEKLKQIAIDWRQKAAENGRPASVFRNGGLIHAMRHKRGYASGQENRWTIHSSLGRRYLKPTFGRNEEKGKGEVLRDFIERCIAALKGDAICISDRRYPKSREIISTDFEETHTFRDKKPEERSQDNAASDIFQSESPDEIAGYQDVFGFLFLIGKDVSSIAQKILDDFKAAQLGEGEEEGEGFRRNGAKDPSPAGGPATTSSAVVAPTTSTARGMAGGGDLPARPRRTASSVDATSSPKESKKEEEASVETFHRPFPHRPSNEYNTAIQLRALQWVDLVRLLRLPFATRGANVADDTYLLLDIKNRLPADLFFEENAQLESGHWGSANATNGEGAAALQWLKKPLQRRGGAGWNGRRVPLLWMVAV